MPRRTPARLRRLFCLALRNTRNWSCFFKDMRGTCSKWLFKLQCGCMVFSTTTERTLAGFFANASACGTGTRALPAAHHSIPVGHFFAFLSSLAVCFNLVMLALVAAWPAARALVRPRNARRALELARAARHLAASSSSRGASAARLPAALPHATVYLPPPCCLRRAARRTRSRRYPVAAATVPARMRYLPLPAMQLFTSRPSRAAEIDPNQTETVWASRAALGLAESPRETLTYATETNTE